MRDLGTLGGDDVSQAVAINDRGQVIGSSFGKSGKEHAFKEHAFLWENGKMRLLAPHHPEVLEATDINDRGQVVGRRYAPRGRWHPFLWQDGKMRDLGVLGKSMTDGEASGINDPGQIVGASYSEDGDTQFHRAFLWANGKMIALPSLPGGERTGADAINNQGQIVGWSSTKGEERAVLWTMKP